MRWDLSDLFISLEDPKIDELLGALHTKAKEFRKTYVGNVGMLAQGNAMRTMLEEYEALIAGVMSLGVYAHLEFSANTQAHETGAFMQKIQSRIADVADQFVFVDVELSQMSDTQIEHFSRTEELANYRHFFEAVLRWKKHHLSENEEKILIRKHLTGRDAFQRLFNQELSEQKFPFVVEGKKKLLSQAEILNLLYSNPSQAERKKAAQVFTRVLKQKKKMLTFIFNTLAADKNADDVLRKYTFPEESRHLSNEITPHAAEAMAKAVTDNYRLVHEYYTFKREVLGLETLYDYDRYAPLPTHTKTYSFEEAKEIVLAAFKSFSQEFYAIANEFFEKNWIDAELRPGKQSGAFCMYVNPQKHPYVFVNFTGSANDVLTLAHELGHAIHGQLARKQTMLNYEWPLTMSETASIFAETITFHYMVSQIDDTETKLGLYMHKIEGIFASVFRQISMYRFEQAFHAQFLKSGELSEEMIDTLWKKSQRPMFGKSVTLTKNYANWWAYIPHFVQTPFYVYAYAFGELLTLSLLKQWEDGAVNFATRYQELLAAGGSKSPQELLGAFQVDLEDGKFWMSGVALIEEYLKKAKDLHGKTLH